MTISDDIKHVKGESLFIDDISIPQDTLHATVFYSNIAHGIIRSIDFTDALETNGVVKIITAEDIPGENQIGNIIADESLLADKMVEFIGEPIAVILAETQEIANHAKSKIKIEFEELQPITDPREAFKLGKVIVPPKIFSSGNVEESFKDCRYVVEDKVEIGGQEHLYLETQSAIAYPTEGKGIKLYSSTQSPTVVQKTAAKVLDLKMHQIEVDVLRLGGGFGGKEDQATAWAVMAALGTHLTNRPVKLVLNRHDDLKITGKRHPYSADYKIGFDEEYKIKALEVHYFQNAGAFADLSTAILERTLFHATNSYFIPNVKAAGYSCKTNLPPNTAYRGFGGPQAMFVIESAIHKSAEIFGISAHLIQKINLIKEGESFFYGQTTIRNQASKCWNEAVSRFNFDNHEKEISEFNKNHHLVKKGISLMPIAFGISFTNTFLNQASALMHIYTDGSISISTAAVEMGQGVNEKMINIASKIFSVNKKRIKIESTNTTRVANSSATAASSAADLNGNALILASEILKKRLLVQARNILSIDENSVLNFQNEKIYADKKETDLTWEELINSAYINRISLSSQAYYATPDIYFDRTINKGNPFAYHVYGTAITVAKVDCLRGTYEIESMEVVHDFGESINKKVDLGQAEGAIVQGIGWMTIEELSQNTKGELKSNTLSTYKVPDIYSIPKTMKVHFLEDSENPYGPFNSKAIGEPPFMYGIGSYFAISNAIKAFNPKVELNYSSPLTHEKTLMQLYQSSDKSREHQNLSEINYSME